MIDRRRYLGLLGAGVTGSVAGCLGRTEPPFADRPGEITGPSAAGLDEIDHRITQLMADAGVPGGAAAIVKDGRLVFSRGYGLTETESETPVQPDSLFRIASISKPITAVAVLELVESGQLDLDTTVLDALSAVTADAEWTDPRLEDVTVRMLLQHTGGWDIHQLGIDFEELQWDPMLNPAFIAERRDTEPPADAETIVRYMLEKRMQFDPGARFSYSNFGYCLLGRIVEAVTDESYESHVKATVLQEMGIDAMRIGGTRRADRADGEVKYYDYGEAPLVESVFPDDGEKTRPYGGFYLEAMDAHGGWVGSPVDLLRFLTHVDGTRDGIVSDEMLTAMVRRPDVERWEDSAVYYGMGWYIGQSQQRESRSSTPESPTETAWWHGGALPGTTALLERPGDDDLGWAVLFNSRPQEFAFLDQVRDIFREEAKQRDEWPDRDLFDEFA